MVCPIFRLLFAPTQKPQNEIYIEEKFSLQDFVTKVFFHSLSHHTGVPGQKTNDFNSPKKTLVETFVILDSPTKKIR